MHHVIVATTNEHKVREISALLGHRQIHLKSLADFEKFPEVIEDGNTFADNARKKAVEYFDYFKKPVIADDSGLEVFALDNQPGVRSARFSGPQANDLSNNQLLLEKLSGFHGEQRKARFVCSVCYKDHQREEMFTGITEGYILEKFQGRGGFGYDPLFYLPEIQQTYSQLDMAEKNRRSHRGKALEQFVGFLIKNKIY